MTAARSIGAWAIAVDRAYLNADGKMTVEWSATREGDDVGARQSGLWFPETGRTLAYTAQRILAERGLAPAPRDREGRVSAPRSAVALSELTPLLPSQSRIDADVAPSVEVSPWQSGPAAATTSGDLRAAQQRLREAHVRILDDAVAQARSLRAPYDDAARACIVAAKTMSLLSTNLHTGALPPRGTVPELSADATVLARARQVALMYGYDLT